MSSFPDSSKSQVGKRNRGPCRICYEDEEAGEIISPCLCKGSQRWIHRECLDRWRASGFQRAMTNCRECGFQYHLELSQESNGLSDGQQKLLQKIGVQSVATFFILQALIIGLGICIRLTDSGEHLVKVFNLPQRPGGEKVGDFWHALNHHKTTYYLAGLLSLLVIVGIVGVAYSCCTTRGRREFPSSGGHGHISFFDAWACNICCEDCGRSCSHSCSCGPHCCDLSFLANDGGSWECGECLLVGIVLALFLLVIVGIFTAVVCIVTAIMRFITQWARLTQMRALAKEYVVEDLASPDEDVDCIHQIAQKQEEMCPTSYPPDKPDAEQVHRALQHDLSRVFGSDPHDEPIGESDRSGGYGSMV